MRKGTKTFSRSFKSLLFIVVLLAIFFALNILEQGFTEHIFQGILLSLALILFLFIGVLFTEVLITDQCLLINKEFLGSGFKADINNITKVERRYSFIFNHWGCRMQIYYHDKNHLEQIGTIQESRYNIEVIKELLRALKEINPSIKLHPQYQDLIDGKVKDEKKFKKLRL